MVGDIAVYGLITLKEVIGSNLGKLIIIMSVPGAPRFLASDWAYRNRKIFDYIPFFREFFTHVGNLTLIEVS